MAAEAVDAIVLDLGLAGHLSGREVARLARDRGVAVLLVTGQCPDDAGEIALACLNKPHSPAALIGALRAIETMICKNKAPRKVAGLQTYRSEEHTSELQSLMRISYAVFCLQNKLQHIYTSHYQLTLSNN